MKILLALGLIIMSSPLFLANPSHAMITETLVPLGHGISGEEIYVNSMKISPDFKHIGYISRIGRRFHVWLDGVSKKSHDGVTRQSPFFSPQQNRLAYIAHEDEKMFVVIDNKEHDHFKKVGTITFSPDGSRLAYRAEDEKGRQRVVVDGKPGPLFDVGIMNTVGVVFSPDSKHFAYAGINRNNSCIFVKDNKKLRSFDKIKQVRFSPDSKHVAYAAMNKGEWFAVKDNKLGSGYKEVANLVFSPDSSQLAYMATKGRRNIAVKNTEEIIEGTAVFLPAFSPDGKRFAYLMGDRKGKFHYVIDGKPGPPVENPGRLVFSKDGTSTVYAGLVNDKWHIFKDHIKGPAFKKIYALSFSPTTNDILYVADTDGEKTCVVNNATPGKLYDTIGVPMFSPDGKKYAYVARENDKEMFMVINATRQKVSYPIIGIPAEKSGFSSQRAFFSRDGHRMAFPVFDPEREKAFMVVDGKAHPPFDVIMEPCFSYDEKHIGYMAKTGDTWRMVVDGKVGRHSCDGMLRGSTIGFESKRNCFFILVANEKDSALSFYRLEAEVKDPS